MSARLFARFGPEEGFEMEFAGEATIGRGEDNTARLTSPEVSQHHARIFHDVESGAWWVEDLGSLNGTRLDGEPVSGRERLGGLHVLSFGSSAELFFVELAGGATPRSGAVESEAPETGAPEAGAPETGAPEGGQPEPPEEGTRVDAEAPTLPPGLSRPPREQTRIDDEAPTLPAGLRATDAAAAAAEAVGGSTQIDDEPVDLPSALAGTARPVRAGDKSAPGAAAPRFTLELIDRPGERFELHEGDNPVGRSGGARIVIADRELSRRHATLRVAAGRVWLRDEGSRNHTYVAGEAIAGEVEIEPGSELRFGRLRARVVAAAPDAEGG